MMIFEGSSPENMKAQAQGRLEAMEREWAEYKEKRFSMTTGSLFKEPMTDNKLLDFVLTC